MKHVVEVPVYLRLEVEVRGKADPLISASRASDVAQQFIKDAIVGNAGVIHNWQFGRDEVTLSHLVPLCPGEDDTPDVFDASGEVQLYPADG